MTICQDCEQFKIRIKKWNYTNGTVDPLPHLDEIIKPHRHLIFEGSKQEGTGCSVLTFQCLGCDHWWKVSSWGWIGVLDIWSWSPISYSIHEKIEEA